ncbi:MAG: hypothetical protein OXG13_00775 [Gemmatimonadaceae bacterium]|nr:hypothetical protein [Gemmatimonadaceae bacterium]
MLLAAGLALAVFAFLLLPVVVAVTGARRGEDGAFDMSAQAAVWAGLLGVRLRRRDPSWELVPTLAGRAVGPGMRLGQPEVQAGAAGIPAAEAPAAPDDGGRGPRIAAAGLRERLRSQSPLARPALRLVRSLPGAFRLRRMRLDGVVGLADPEATGRLFGLVHALAPAAPERVALSLTPDFTHPCLHGRAEVRLHLRLARLLYMAARFGLATGRIRAAARLRSWLAARRAGRKGNR